MFVFYKFFLLSIQKSLWLDIILWIILSPGKLNHINLFTKDFIYFIPIIGNNYFISIFILIRNQLTFIIPTTFITIDVLTSTRNFGQRYFFVVTFYWMNTIRSSLSSKSSLLFRTQPRRALSVLMICKGLILVRTHKLSSFLLVLSHMNLSLGG